MNEEEYFEKSRKSKCVLRCPILNYCARRAYTIFCYSDFQTTNPNANYVTPLKEHGILPDDFEEKMIKLGGEAPSWSKGTSYISYQNMCPEVNLFDNDHCLPFASGLASISGERDKEKVDRFNNIKNRHFAECLEYNSYIFEKVTNKKPKQRRRSPISPTLRFEIFQRDKYTCQCCGRSKEDGIKLVLDHKIPYSDGGKDSFSNLTTLCEECNNGKSNKRV